MAERFYVPEDQWVWCDTVSSSNVIGYAHEVFPTGLPYN